jgi:histidinol phosphatase-like enzyme (inositol monophosphatase family)
MKRAIMKNFLHELLDASTDIIRHYYTKGNFGLEEKSNKTPVTKADRESELIMRKMIADRFPEHGIIGEEYGNHNEHAEYVWVLDPIDGTIAFIHGVPLFVTLIALLKNGQPILGAINQPIAELRCTGDNETAWFNGEQVRMRQAESIEKSTMLSTDIGNIHRMHNKKGFNELFERAHLFRTWGDGFGYLLLARGLADIMLDAKMAPWDILPVIPVVRGAGAKITTFSGGDPVTGSSAVCAHPSLHDEILAIVRA